MEEEWVFYDVNGNRVPYWQSKEAKAIDRERAEKERKEREAYEIAREKRWAEEERQRKIQEAIPKMTVKRVAEIARSEKKWLFDPETRQWWTPEEYVDVHGRTTYGNDKFFARIEMKDPIESINKSWEILQGDIEFEDRDKLLKKFKRFREFVDRVIKYYRG